MLGQSKFAAIAAIPLLGALLTAAPALASAQHCWYYGCGSELPYWHHHVFVHGPDHDYWPMYFHDGHGGYIGAQWYWGGLTWHQTRPPY